MHVLSLPSFLHFVNLLVFCRCLRRVAWLRFCTDLKWSRGWQCPFTLWYSRSRVTIKLWMTNYFFKGDSGMSHVVSNTWGLCWYSFWVCVGFHRCSGTRTNYDQLLSKESWLVWPFHLVIASSVLWQQKNVCFFSLHCPCRLMSSAWYCCTVVFSQDLLVFVLECLL